MQRVLFLAPLEDTLTDTQKSFIHTNFAAWLMATPNTRSKEGLVICDAICIDDFSPVTDMQEAGIDWPVLGHWRWDGIGSIETVQSLDSRRYLARLNSIQEYDATGAPAGTRPAVLEEVHSWAGWPTVI